MTSPAFRRERLKLTKQACVCFGSIIWRLWFRRIIFLKVLSIISGVALVGCGSVSFDEMGSILSRPFTRRDYPQSDRERWQFMYEHGQLTLPEYQKLIGAKD